MCIYHVRRFDRVVQGSSLLAGQSLGDVGAVCLAKELIGNTAVKELLLGGNQISDVGAKAIAIALRSNNTLSTLSLVNNKVTDVGAGELLSALQQNKTIREIALSGTSRVSASSHLRSGNQVTESVLASLSLILLSRKTSSTSLDKRPSSSALVAPGSPLQKSSSGSSSSSQGTPGQGLSPQRSASQQLSISTAVPLRTCTGPRLLRYGSADPTIAAGRKAMRRKVSRLAWVLKPNRLARMAPVQAGKPDVDLSQIEAFVTHVAREKGPCE